MARYKAKQPAYQADRCRISRVHQDGSVTMACKIAGAPGMLAVKIDASTARRISRR